MRSTTIRGWLLGLALGLGTSAGLFAALRHSQREQTGLLQHSLDEVRRELAAHRQLTLETSRAFAPADARAPAPEVARSGVEGPGRLSREEVEAIAVRVVALMREQGLAASATREAPVPVGPPSAEQQAALERASALVERVLARGQMTREDVMEMRNELSSLGQRPEVDELRRRLIIAINQDRLRPPQGMLHPLP